MKADIITKYQIYQIKNGLLLPFKQYRLKSGGIDTESMEFETYSEAEEYCKTKDLEGATILPITVKIWVD